MQAKLLYKFIRNRAAVFYLYFYSVHEICTRKKRAVAGLGTREVTRLKYQNVSTYTYYVSLRRDIMCIMQYTCLSVLTVIVRPLSTVGYTSVAASVMTSRQWSN